MLCYTLYGVTGGNNRTFEQKYVQMYFLLEGEIYSNISFTTTILIYDLRILKKTTTFC